MLESEKTVSPTSFHATVLAKISTTTLAVKRGPEIQLHARERHCRIWGQREYPQALRRTIKSSTSMRREFCYLPDEFTDALIAFGNANGAWCYKLVGPVDYSKIELADPNVKKTIYGNDIADVQLHVGFNSLVPFPVWNNEYDSHSIDMAASYSIQFLMPQFNSNRTILSFGYMATMDKNRFEDAEMAMNLMKFCNEFCKILGKSRTKEYVIQSAKASHLWKDVWVSKNVVKHADELMFTQLAALRPERKGDFRLIKI